MRLSETMPQLRDDLEFSSLVSALESNVKQLRDRKDTNVFLDFGPRRVNRAEYARSLEFLLLKAKEDKSGESFRRALSENFEAYEVYGKDKWGQVFITSYYEPVIEGAAKPAGRFTQPIYGVPKDLVVIDVSSFATVAPGLEQKGREGFLRGRLLAPQNKDDLPKVVAYPERAEIDTAPLSAPVLAYADPVDAFFLEIQGSGIVKLSGGKELKVGYAAQNGHPYVAIGKSLTSVMPKEKITLHSIESHLRQIGPEEARKIMQTNPSYVFFRPLQSFGLTFFGTEVVPGRTIATDYTYFPKGTLAFLEFDKPLFADAQAVEPSSWQPTGRFVLDQDTGGAIRGPHRVDLFWGRGPSAKQAAGVMKNNGRLVYFVPRPDFLRRLSVP